jgi:hypothetical protein
MGTRDASESFLKVAMTRGREAQRRQRTGKRRVLEDEDEEDGMERRGKARRREAAAVIVKAIAMGMVPRWGVGFMSVASGRSSRAGARSSWTGDGVGDGQVMN